MKLWLDNKMAEHEPYPESWLNRYDAGPVHPYWKQRVGEAAARNFRLGYDPGADACTYPLRDPSGQVLGVVRRALGGDGPRYRYPPGADMGRLLFQYTPTHREAVVLTEGALDAIALWNVGIDAFAIYGSRLSAEQVRLIDRIEPAYVFTCYDLDQAGWNAHLETRKLLRHRVVDRMTWPKAWGADIDEVDPTLRREVVDVLVSQGLACIE